MATMTTPSHKLLAIDTGTDVMSVAVSRTEDGHTQVWQHTGPGAAKASTSLIATVLDLMQQSGMALRDLDAICFGSGPGAFTGLRTACSVAQGLGLGAGVPLLGVNALMAIAEEARIRAGGQATGHAAQGAPGYAPGQVLVSLLDARMDEVYAAAYRWQGAHWQALSDSMLLRPEQLAFGGLHLADSVDAPLQAPYVLAGNAFGPYAQRLPLPWQTLQRAEALPTARAMLQLAPYLLAQGQAVPAEQALPAYIRDKVAQTTAERASQRAAQQAAPVPPMAEPAQAGSTP